jgi:hypothetical protein
MRKTIDLSKDEINAVEEYQKRNGLKNFSEAMRNMVSSMNSHFKQEESDMQMIVQDGSDISDENFALLGSAIVEMDKKIEKILKHIELIAPKSAGEI